MKPKKVLLDTDIGSDVDDLLALILAVKSPELDIEGVTTVGLDADRRARLAQRILRTLNREDIPVMVGLSRPIVRDPQKVWGPYDGHGIDISNELLKQPLSPLKAIDFLVSKVLEFREEITLITLGPLTNIAIALLVEPCLTKVIRECFIMGGVIQKTLGRSALREYNVSSDPEAANIVFSSRMPMTIVGLDVTLQVPLNRERLMKIGMARSPGAKLAFQAAMNYQERVVMHPWNYLHDPLTVGVAIERSFVKTRKMHIRIETKGSLTDGWVVSDNGSPEDSEAPEVAIEVNSEGFLDFFVERVSSP
ncbi:nucleoside hydrolase [Candidatus Bathyarchaeota archaeon]|nr:nucleoside hydrolase [Candidatus Bathyarchaeota archaeon]